MNGYIITLLVISFVGGIINSILPDGGLKKYVKYIISLVCVISLVSPLTSIALNAASIKDGVTSFIDEIIINTWIKAEMKSLLSEKNATAAKTIMQSMLRIILRAAFSGGITTSSLL